MLRGSFLSVHFFFFLYAIRQFRITNSSSVLEIVPMFLLKTVQILGKLKYIQDDLGIKSSTEHDYFPCGRYNLLPFML